MAGSAGWGYLAADDPEQFARTYERLVAAVMQGGPTQGFCYTQLTDVEQEQNGLLRYDRTPKIDPVLIRPLTQMAKT
jgi:hypothetical protein